MGGKRVSLSDKLKESNIRKDDLFKITSEENNSSSDVSDLNNDKKVQRVKKTTFNLPYDLYKAMKQTCLDNDLNNIDLVIEGLEYIIDKYNN